jgi:hypothetical protein
VAVRNLVAVVGGRGSGAQIGFATVYRNNGTSWVEEQTLVASDGANGDFFGRSVGVDGNVVVVGADGDNDLGTDSGSAYVFRFNGTSWQQEQKLLASNGGAGDQFGWAVDVEDDVIVVGALFADGIFSGSGAAYVYRFNGSNWQQEDLISEGGAGSRFGVDVSIDRQRILAGASWHFSLEGRAYLFEYDGNGWPMVHMFSQQNGDPGDAFGDAVDLFGHLAIIGSVFDDPLGNDSGSATIFRDLGGLWLHEALLTASDGALGGEFGNSVAVYQDFALVGSWLHFGFFGPGSTYLFRYDGNTWREQARLLSSDAATFDQYADDVALHGKHIFVGASGEDDAGSAAGAAYTFERPDLTLQFAPTALTTGSTVTVTSCGGVPFNLVLLYVVAIDNVPTFLRTPAGGSFNNSGVFSLTADLPLSPGLFGISFRTFSLDRYGVAIQSNIFVESFF